MFENNLTEFFFECVIWPLRAIIMIFQYALIRKTEIPWPIAFNFRSGRMHIFILCQMYYIGLFLQKIRYIELFIVNSMNKAKQIKPIWSRVNHTRHLFFYYLAQYSEKRMGFKDSIVVVVIVVQQFNDTFHFMWL